MPGPARRRAVTRSACRHSTGTVVACQVDPSRIDDQEEARRERLAETGVETSATPASIRGPQAVPALLDFHGL